MPRKTLIVSTILLLFLFTMFVFLPFYHTVPRKTVPFFVRISLLDEVRQFSTGSKGRLSIYDSGKNILLKGDIRLAPGTAVNRSSGGIKVGNESFNCEEIKIIPADGKPIFVDRNRYHGEIYVIRDGSGLSVVNRVEIEYYLKGVLPKEVYVFWPMAALEAQAITARSFAVFEVLRNRRNRYDLTADTYSQVYAGESAEKYRTNIAVDRTRGLVLEFDGRVLQAFFHSCCGGHTRSASDLWGIKLDPLKGVKCPWCRWSPFFRWSSDMKTADLLYGLKEAGYDLESLDDIRPGRKDGNGFIIFMKVRSGKNWYDIPVREFRGAAGRNLIRSSNFKVKKRRGSYLFYGSGWGHGVGMCQWGAFGASLRRWSAERILEHYYPGAKVVLLDKLMKRDEEAKK